MRRIGEHLANPDLNTIDNSNLEQWPEVGAVRQTELYFAMRFKLPFVKKWGISFMG
jgi:hypothetical protein